MIFYGLRKFAHELGLEIQSGVACGIYEGYVVGLWDFFDSKSFCISARFDDDFGEELQMELIELKAKYRRLIYIRLWKGVLLAKFFAHPETMKQFRDCFYDVIDLLEKYDIPDADICPRCGLPMYGKGVWSIYRLSNLQCIFYAHESCMAKLELETKCQQERKGRKHAPQKGNRLHSKIRYFPGWMGALGGCILSTIFFILLMLPRSSYHGGRRAVAICCGGVFIRAGYDMTKDSHGTKRSLTIIIMTMVSIVLGILGFFIIRNIIDRNFLQTISEGISAIEACRLFIRFAIQIIIEEKRFIIGGMCIFIPLSLLSILDVIIDLYYGEEGRQIHCKRLQKRK